MISYVTAKLRYAAVQDGVSVPQTGTLVQVIYPVMTILDADTPQLVRPDPVNGVFDASGDLKAPDGTSALLLLDPTDDRLSPHDYSVTVKIMPQNGGLPWQFDAVLTVRSGDGSYDLALNRSADPTSPTFVTQGPPGDSALDAPYTANISGAYTIDASKPVQVLTVTGAVTISMPAVPAGKTTPITVKFIQDSTGYPVTVPTVASTPPCMWGEKTPPTIATTPASRHTLYFVGYPNDNTWDGFVSGTNQG